MMYFDARSIDDDQAVEMNDHLNPVLILHDG
jgi:hypothetical protein